MFDDVKTVVNALDAANLADNAVTTAKIASGAVTNAKIGAGAVDTNELANEAVTAAKLDPAIGTLTEVLPAGTIVATGRSTAASGYLMCDGSIVNRTTYSALFTAIGTAYGSGDGSTTFQLPDLRGRVPVGKNSATFGTLGGTTGAETITLTGAQSGLPAHVHGFTTDPGGTHVHEIGGVVFQQDTSGSLQLLRTNAGGTNSQSGGSHTHTGTTSSASASASEAHSNLQPSQTVNYMIKTGA
jgi:microcystin-dependent protein